MIDLQLNSNFDLLKAVLKRHPKVQFSKFYWSTSSWSPIMTFKWHLWPPVTSEQYFSARFGFPNTKNLWKDTHKSNTVDFNDWPPVDLQFWPPNSSYDLQWHLSSILVPDMDSQVQKTNIKTPICAIQLIFMFDLQLTSNFDLQIAVMTSSDTSAVF